MTEETKTEEKPKPAQYKKGKISKQVRVELTYPSYPGVKFRFLFERYRKMDSDEEIQAAAINGEENAVDWLARNLVERPEGFGDGSEEGDFPLDGELPANVRKFFKDPDEPWLADMAEDVRWSYRQVVRPSAFFR